MRTILDRQLQDLSEQILLRTNRVYRRERAYQDADPGIIVSKRYF